MSIGYFEAFYFSRIRLRMVIGIVLMFTTQLGMTSSQIMLDKYLSAYWRGGIISLTTSLSFVGLCFFISGMQRKITRNLVATAGVMAVMALLMLLLNEEQLRVPVIVVAPLLRMLSCLGFGVILIWAIETFPTVFRLMGCCFVMAGGSFAGILPYLFR